MAKNQNNFDVKSWLKNFSKSIAYSAKSVLVDELMPQTSEDISTTINATKEVVDKIKSNTTVQAIAQKKFDNVPAVKEAKKILNGMVRDLKSGDFSIPKDNDFFDDNDVDMDFDLTEFEDEDGNSDSFIEISNDAKLTSKAVIYGAEHTTEALEELSKSIGKGISGATRANIEASKASATFVINALSPYMVQMNEQLSNINTNVASVVEFLRDSQQRLNEASMTHFSRMEEISSVQLQILTGKKKGIKDTDDPMADIRAFGFSMDKYLKVLKKNFDRSDFMSTISMISGMGSMLSGFGEMAGGMSNMVRPLDMLLQGTIKALLPKNAQKSIKNLDEVIHRAIPSFLDRLSDSSDEMGLLGFISQVFGFEREKTAKIRFGDYTKTAVAWDGYSKRALEEVIPYYLAKIDAGVNHRKELELYDYKSGRFKSSKAVIEEAKETVYGRLQESLQPSKNLIESLLKTSSGDYKGRLSEKQFLEIQRNLMKPLVAYAKGEEIKGEDGKLHRVKYEDLHKMIQSSIDNSVLSTILTESQKAALETMIAGNASQLATAFKDIGKDFAGSSDYTGLRYAYHKGAIKGIENEFGDSQILAANLDESILEKNTKYTRKTEYEKKEAKRKEDLKKENAKKMEKSLSEHVPAKGIVKWVQDRLHKFSVYSAGGGRIDNTISGAISTVATLIEKAPGMSTKELQELRSIEGLKNAFNAIKNAKGRIPIPQNSVLRILNNYGIDDRLYRFETEEIGGIECFVSGELLEYPSKGSLSKYPLFLTQKMFTIGKDFDISFNPGWDTSVKRASDVAPKAKINTNEKKKPSESSGNGPGPVGYGKGPAGYGIIDDIMNLPQRELNRRLWANSFRSELRNLSYDEFQEIAPFLRSIGIDPDTVRPESEKMKGMRGSAAYKAAKLNIQKASENQSTASNVAQQAKSGFQRSRTRASWTGQGIIEKFKHAKENLKEDEDIKAVKAKFKGVKDYVLSHVRGTKQQIDATINGANETIEESKATVKEYQNLTNDQYQQIENILLELGLASENSAEQIKEFADKFGTSLFGKDQDETIANIKSSWTKFSMKASDIANEMESSRRGKLKGIIGALIGGFIGKKLMKAGPLNILAASFSVAGPIGVAVAGLAGGIMAAKVDFKKLLLGDENVDENGELKKKKKSLGLVDRIYNAFKVNVVDEMTMGVKGFMRELTAFTKAQLGPPLKRAFSPVTKGVAAVLSAAGEKGLDVLKNIGGKIKGSISKLATSNLGLTQMGIRFGFFGARKAATGGIKGLGKLTRGISRIRKKYDYKKLARMMKLTPGQVRMQVDSKVDEILTRLGQVVTPKSNAEDVKAAFQAELDALEDSPLNAAVAANLIEIRDYNISNKKYKEAKIKGANERFVQNVRRKAFAMSGNDPSSLSSDQLKKLRKQLQGKGLFGRVHRRFMHAAPGEDEVLQRVLESGDDEDLRAYLNNPAAMAKAFKKIDETKNEEDEAKKAQEAFRNKVTEYQEKAVSEQTKTNVLLQGILNRESGGRFEVVGTTNSEDSLAAEVAASAVTKKEYPEEKAEDEAAILDVQHEQLDDQTEKEAKIQSDATDQDNAQAQGAKATRKSSFSRKIKSIFGLDTKEAEEALDEETKKDSSGGGILSTITSALGSIGKVAIPAALVGLDAAFNDGKITSAIIDVAGTVLGKVGEAIFDWLPKIGKGILDAIGGIFSGIGNSISNPGEGWESYEYLDTDGDGIPDTKKTHTTPNLGMWNAGVNYVGHKAADVIGKGAGKAVGNSVKESLTNAWKNRGAKTVAGEAVEATIETGTKEAAGAAAEQAGKEAVEGAVDSAVDTGVKEAAGNAVKETAGDALEKSNRSWLGKAIDKIKNLIKSALESKTVKKVLGENADELIGSAVEWVSKKLDSILSVPKKMLNWVVKKITNALAAAGIELGAAAISAGISFAVGAVLDGIGGFSDAPTLFEVSKEDCNWKMRACATVIGIILGFGSIGPIVDCMSEIFYAISGFNFKGMLAQKLYTKWCEFTGDEDGLQELSEAQQELDAAYEAAKKEANNENLTKQAFLQEQNKGVFDRFGEALFGKDDEYTELSDEEAAEIQASGNYRYGTTPKSAAELTALQQQATAGSLGYGNGQQPVGYGFRQGDSRWANKSTGRFGNGQKATMKTAGCGFAALADVDRMYGGKSTPASIADMAMRRGDVADGGATGSLFERGVNGIHGTQLSGADQLRSSLESGEPVVISGQAGYGEGPEVFPSSNRHLVVGRGMDSAGNVIIENPMKGRQRVPFSKLARETKDAWAMRKGAAGYGALGLNGESAAGSAIPQSKSSISPIYYSQLDSQWSGKPMGNSTLYNVGCTLSSAAMATANLTGEDTNPGVIWDLAHDKLSGGGVTPAFYNKINSKYGIESEEVTDQSQRATGANNPTAWNAALAALKEGKPVSLQGNKQYNAVYNYNGSTQRTSGQNEHNILAIGMTDDGRIAFLDPSDTTKAGDRGKARIGALDASAFNNGVGLRWARIFSKDGKGIDAFKNIDGSQITTSAGNYEGGVSGSSSGSDGSSSESNGILDIFSKIGSGLSAIASNAMKAFFSGGKYERALDDQGNVLSNNSDASSPAATDTSGSSGSTGSSSSGGETLTDEEVAARVTGSTLEHFKARGQQYDASFNPSLANYLNKDLGKWAPVTTSTLNKYINDKVSPGSIFKGQASSIIAAANQTGLDPRYLLAHAGLETAWGTSDQAKNKNNYFGINAYNDDPSQATSFEGSGWMEGAKWIKDNYYSKGQTTLAQMLIENPAHTYATYDTATFGREGPNYSWGNTIAGTMKNMGFGPGPSAKIKKSMTSMGYGISSDANEFISGLETRLDNMVDLLTVIADNTSKIGESENSGFGNGPQGTPAKEALQELRDKKTVDRIKKNTEDRSKTSSNDLGRSRLVAIHNAIASGYRGVKRA